MGKKKQPRTAVLGTVFGLYCGVMLWLLFDRPSAFTGWDTYLQQLGDHKNLIPLLTIRNYLQVILYRTNDDVLKHCVINLTGNILLFIPAGYLLPRLWGKQTNFFWFFLTCLGAIVLVELLQLLTLRGSFDVDDILLNLLGMIIGFVAFHIANKPSARK